MDIIHLQAMQEKSEINGRAIKKTNFFLHKAWHKWKKKQLRTDKLLAEKRDNFNARELSIK